MEPAQALQWTDVHTHLNMLNISPEEALKAARQNGVKNVITIGTEPKDWPQVLEYAGTFPNVRGAVGMHPHHATLYNDSIEADLKTHLDQKNIIACGEIGLDYHYNHSPREVQKTAFRRQMHLAAEKGLPVEIHTRDAEEDTKTILGEFKGKVRGLLHCFTSSWSLAKAALDMDYHISFSGIISFKNAHDLRDTCKKVPLNSMHLETDAPYLAPIPYRGKPNQPAWLIHTAEVVAKLKNIPLKELSHATEQNSKTLFKNKNSQVDCTPSTVHK